MDETLWYFLNRMTLLFRLKRNTVLSFYFVTNRKRSLGKGNIFRSVRDSVRDAEAGDGGWRSPSRGKGLPTWGLPLGESAYRGWSIHPEGLPTVVDLPPEGLGRHPRNQKSGRYASYWNAFLLDFRITLLGSLSSEGGT